MTVLVFEDNLMWSSRLVKSLTALGHEPIVRTTADLSPSGAAAAIVNLGSDRLDAESLVPALNAAGVVTIGHAGHKETEVLQFGRDIGCRILATNSEITFHLEKLLSSIGNISSPASS